MADNDLTTTPAPAARILLVEGDDAVAQAETALLTDGGFTLTV